QFPTTDGPPGGVFTDRIPFFRGVATGVHVNAADILLVALLALCLLKAGAGAGAVPRSGVTYALCGLLGAVALGLFVGRLHGGSLRTAFTEVRPYVYLATAFALVSSFAADRAALRQALWAVVLATGAKAVQTLVFFLHVRHLQPRPQAVVGHEEAFFFALFVILACSLWLFDVPGRLRTVATALLPVVLLANLANGRRAAWLILGAALCVLIAIGFVCAPERRRLLRRTCAVLVVVSTVYFPVYW